MCGWTLAKVLAVVLVDFRRHLQQSTGPPGDFDSIFDALVRADPAQKRQIVFRLLPQLVFIQRQPVVHRSHPIQRRGELLLGDRNRYQWDVAKFVKQRS